MSEVRRIVRQAARRLFVMDLLDALAVLITAGLSLVLLARLSEQLFGLTLPWTSIAYGTAGGVVLVALVWTWIQRRREIAVARVLDERAGLRETLSTALYYETDAGPWAQAVRESASRTAVGVKVGYVVPIEPPKRWALPTCTALAVALIWIVMPKWDILGKNAVKVAEREKQLQVFEVKQELAADRQKLQDALAKAKVEFLDEKTDPNEAVHPQKPEANDPDALRRAEVKTLTDIADKLETAKEGEKGKQLDALKQAMKQLRQPGDGPLNEFARNLARGDFNKAQDALKEVQDKLASDAFSPEDKAKLEKQLQKLSEQLKELSKNQQQVAKELQKAGLDAKQAQDLAKKAASDPKALEEAVQKLDSLSDQQKEGLLEMAKAASKAGEQAGDMSESMSKMAKGMSQQGMQQDGQQGAQELSQELNESEMMEQDMDNLEAALKETKSQLSKLGQGMSGNGPGKGDKPGDGQGQGQGQGQFAKGDSSQKGQGSGGPGQSAGGPRPDGEPTDFTMEKKKAQVKNTGGPVIGTRLVYGQQVKGESRAQFEDAVSSGATSAAEAIESMQVPRELHDAVKHYFGTLEAKAKPGSGAPASGSGEPKKDEGKKDEGKK
jgi:chemotaxis protein histidine kinase CheA